jgi:hypothetical protein
MANRSAKGESRSAAALHAMNRGLARLASSARICDDVERVTKRVDMLGRPMSARGSKIHWEEVLNATRTGSAMEKLRGALAGWSGQMRKIEASLLDQHPDAATFEKDLAIGGALVDGAVGLSLTLDALGKFAVERQLPNLKALVEPFAKVAGMSLDWSAAVVLRAVRSVASIISAAALEAGAAEASPFDLTAPQIVISALAGGDLGKGIYDLGIKRSRLEGRLASHLHDQGSDVRLRRWEMRGGVTNTWRVTHAPQITVVVNGADAAHPRKIAEQMVMALQSHHSELDQKLTDVWKRQAVRDERTGF